MTKQEARDLFGGTKSLCKAVGIVEDTFYRWPKELTQEQADRVRGAYLRVAEERDRALIHEWKK